MLPQVYLVRHGATSWSSEGRHTGRTEIPLTVQGERNARGLAARLGAVAYTHVFTSPRLRARRTCELAGLGGAAEIDPDLAAGLEPLSRRLPGRRIAGAGLRARRPADCPVTEAGGQRCALLARAFRASPRGPLDRIARG